MRHNKCMKHVFLFPKVLPKTISVPKGFNKLKPFWVSEPPSGSRTMSTPTKRKKKRQKNKDEELFMSLCQLDIQEQKKEKTLKY